MILDLLTAATGIAYIVFMSIGLYRSCRTASLPDMDRAIAYFIRAFIAAFIAFFVAVMRVDEHGWSQVGFSGAFLAGSVVVICLAVGRADRMEDSR